MKRLTPLKAIRARCVDCSGFIPLKARGCPLNGVRDVECPLWPLRMGRGARATLKRIRAYCLWCCNGQGKEVKLCPSAKCPLWEYRFGKRPQKSVSVSEISTTEGVLGDKRAVRIKA